MPCQFSGFDIALQLYSETMGIDFIPFVNILLSSVKYLCFFAYFSILTQSHKIPFLFICYKLLPLFPTQLVLNTIVDGSNTETIQQKTC